MRAPGGRPPGGRPAPRRVDVLAKRLVTPNMLRVTLGGAGLDGFPAGVAGGYVKLRLFPDGPDGPLVVRTYTIRAQRPDAIDVDFALHQDAVGAHGPATDWAMAVEPGDSIEMGGPGPAKPLPSGAGFYLVAGDMTALPAISVNLENLARDARGHAVIEVQSDADRQELDAPPGVTVEWIVNPVPGTASDALADRLRAAAPDGGDLCGWAAAEFNAMKALRDFLRGERGLTPDRLYVSSYWKAGLSEEEHKVVKREDGEALGA